MGRLDEDAKGKSAPGEPESGLDELENLEDLAEIEELELALKDIHPASLGVSSRRKLEERLEDLRLQHQINDYDFKI